MNMSRGKIILLICLTYGMLFGHAYGLIGSKVQGVRSGNFTFAVSVSDKPTNTSAGFVNHHFCTGSVISFRSVLTAAHCLKDKQHHEVEVIAGSTNLRHGKKYEIDTWTTFVQWNHGRKTQYPLNDIAVIILKGQGITTIYPLSLSFNDNEPFENQEIRVMGWGVTEKGRFPYGLRAAYLKVISNKECSDYGTLLKGQSFNVPPNYFCSKAEPWIVSTPGDGGAPILDKNHRLIGINIGTCPKLENYPEDMLHNILMNSHLRLHYYKEFLSYTMR